MGIGTSILLIAVGAILDFAVKVNSNNFNVNTIGLILMIVGAVGLVISLIFWNSWGGFGGYRRRSVYDNGVNREVVEQRETY
jgi:sulfite exporter TauE/SafE